LPAWWISERVSWRGVAMEIVEVDWGLAFRFMICLV